MHKDAYHHIEVHAPPLGGASEQWLWERLANARATFLQRLGITSGSLRVDGLRLRMETPLIVLDRQADDAPLGITTQLLAIDQTLTFGEALYRVDELWQPLWRGTTRLWVEREGMAVDLPAALRREAEAWLRLIRGTIPVAPPGAGTLKTHIH
jgi:hypothetical protein